jgi:hypothetical protein
MANQSKKKGTEGENELKSLLMDAGIEVHRTPASHPYDLRRGEGYDGGLDVLATRPDRGYWLATLRLGDFLDLVKMADDTYSTPWEPFEGPLNIEVKRYKSFAHHSLWDKKFGPSKAPKQRVYPMFGMGRPR